MLPGKRGASVYWATTLAHLGPHPDSVPTAVKLAKRSQLPEPQCHLLETSPVTLNVTQWGLHDIMHGGMSSRGQLGLRKHGHHLFSCLDPLPLPKCCWGPHLEPSSVLPAGHDSE